MNQELKEALEFVFKNNPDETALIATPDGNVWFGKDKSLAKLHADRSNQELSTYNREDFDLESDSKTKTEQPVKPYSKMVQAELHEACTLKGIQFDEGTTNKDLVVLLKLFDEKLKSNPNPAKGGEGEKGNLGTGTDANKQ